MEAAAQPSPSQTGLAGPPPKLSIDKFADGGIVCLKLAGTIDESFEGKKLAATLRAETLVLDLADIKKISSFGIREWVDFMTALAKQVKSIVLLECAPKVVDQLNMVANFAGAGKVFSFYAPYRCDYCDTDSRVLLQVDKDWETIKSMKMPQRPCPQCGEGQYFDEDPATFFAYIIGQDKFELDAQVAAFLSAKLNYTVSEASRKLRVDKLIEARATFLRLAGDLDASFPREKLAEGLEGTVIVDVAGVGRIEPAGAAEWRGFLQMVTPGADAIYLLTVPPAFLEKLTRPEDLGAKAQVLSFSIPYTCSKCATTTAQQIDVEQHYDVLKFATPPEMKCPDCKSAMVCAATEGLLTHLPSLPKPSVSPEAKKLIKDLSTRKAEKKKVATTVAEAAAAGKSGGAWMGAALMGFLVIAGVGGFFAYRAFSQKSAQAGVALGHVTKKSAETRPKWIASDTPFSSYCTDAKDGTVSCVGVSSPAPSPEDGEDEARDAALDGVANAIGTRIGDAKWQAGVEKVFDQVRQAKLDAYQHDPDSANARRDVREARKAVAASLRATGGGAVPAAPSGKYWEEYEGEAGKRYLVFVQYQLSTAEAKRLVDSYSHTENADGVTVVGMFPQVAWRYPKVTEGAIVIDVAKGNLKNASLTDQTVVLEVGGRAVRDSSSFSKVVTEELDRLKEKGGRLELRVQAGDGGPSTFTAQIPGQPAVVPAGSGTAAPHGSGGNTGGGHGNVNVWDRYNPGSGAGRDDPTQ
jgi:anti-anti-sigma regulatory factor